MAMIGMLLMGLLAGRCTTHACLAVELTTAAALLFRRRESLRKEL